MLVRKLKKKHSIYKLKDLNKQENPTHYMLRNNALLLSVNLLPTSQLVYKCLFLSFFSIIIVIYIGNKARKKGDFLISAWHTK